MHFLHGDLGAFEVELSHLFVDVLGKGEHEFFTSEYFYYEHAVELVDFVLPVLRQLLHQGVHTFAKLFPHHVVLDDVLAQSSELNEVLI